jgi:hypothetical protein
MTPLRFFKFINFQNFLGPYQQGPYQPPNPFGGPEQPFGPHNAGQYPPNQNQYSTNRQIYPPYGPEESYV